MRLFGDRDMPKPLPTLLTTPDHSFIIIPRQHITQYFAFHHFDTPRPALAGQAVVSLAPRSCR
jgi:hypothetical protein